MKKKTKEEKAEIHWGGETGVKNRNHHGRSYAPKGKISVKESMSKKFSVKMISTVTNRAKVEFMLYSSSINAEQLKNNIENHMKILQDNSEGVKKYFNHENIIYAA